MPCSRLLKLALAALLAVLPANAFAANSTVSALTAASALTGAELLYCVQGAADRKCTVTQATTYTMSLFSGDCTATSGGALTCTATNGAAFGGLATITPGTGVATALAINIGTSGSMVANGGALGTPSSGTLTHATGLPVSTGISGLGTGVATALADATGASGGMVTVGGALGTPSSGTGTNLTGIPLNTGLLNILPLAGSTMNAGSWYPLIPSPTSTGTAGTASGTVVCTPGIIPLPLTIEALGIAITTNVSSGNVQLAIAANEPTHNKPGTVLGNTASLSTTTATTVTGTFAAGSGSNVAITTPGVYWFCLNRDSTAGATVAYQAVSRTGLSTYILGSTTAANVGGAASGTSVSAVSVSEAYGTWSNWTSSTTWSDTLFSNAPYVIFEVVSVP